MASSRKTTVPQLVLRLQQLRKAEAPAVVRAVARDVLVTMTREGAANIFGRVLARTAPNADLARYYTQALRTNVEWTDNGMRAGLPEGDLPARILAHRETGGVIRMRDKMLRVPLDPARTAAGRDRYQGIDLKVRIGTPQNPFKVVKLRSGNVFLAREVMKGRGKAKKPQLELWYVLKRQVTNRPHPWFKAAVDVTRPQVTGFLVNRLRQLEEGKVPR